jgi:hypothetical protein
MFDTKETLFLVNHLIELFRSCGNKKPLLDGMGMKACAAIQGRFSLVGHEIWSV